MRYYSTIKDRKIRIAIVGCGRIAINHFRAIKAYPDELELVAACDNDVNALNLVTDTYKIKGYLSLTDMLKKEEFDPVNK